MAVEGAINRRAGQVFYDLTFRNAGTGLLSGIAIQVNKNVMGLTNAAALAVGTIPPGGVETVALMEIKAHFEDELHRMQAPISEAFVRQATTLF